MLSGFVALLHAVGVRPDVPLLQVVLPIGISFFTFQALSYVVDVYRGRLMWMQREIAMNLQVVETIHLGALFGTTMAFNVWFRIWPAQRQIITAVKNGTPPDAALVALAGARSRHNTYMSVPLVWTMINQHTTPFAGGNLGLTSQTAFVSVLVMVLLGWHIVWQLYKRAGKVQGF